MSRRKKPTNGRAASGGQLNGLVLTDQFKPITQAQNDVFESWNEDYNLFLYGCAGTGKTAVALFLALNELIKHPELYDKVYIVRSAVATRDMGFMPGTLTEKSLVYELPYIQLIKKLFSRGDAYDILKQKEKVVFLTTSYLRGVTFDNCIVLADEIQNANVGELHTLITRTGRNCRMILAGDIDQNDLTKHKHDISGMMDFMKVIAELEEFDMIRFEIDDIVRSGLVKNYIKARLKLGLGSAVA